MAMDNEMRQEGRWWNDIWKWGECWDDSSRWFMPVI